MFYVKYISFVCFLGGRFVGAASSDSGMIVVMETDANYTIPTAVAMHSMERHSTHPLTFLVFVADDVAESQKLCTLLSNVKRETDCVYLIKMAPLLESIGEKAKRLSNDFVKIRVLLPDILRSKDIPFVYGKVNLKKTMHFLWIDSDLIVLKDISQLYQHWLETSDSNHQPFMSSNLAFFRRFPDRKGNPYMFNGGVGSVLGPYGGSDSFVGVSGGVVLWNLIALSSLIPHTECGFAKKKPGESHLQYCIRRTSELSEEGVMNTLFNLYFSECQGQNGFFFFSPVCNCRSAYIDEAKKILSCEEEINPDDRDVLQNIVEMKVAILHWDSEKKPWTFTKEEMEKRELQWKNDFPELEKGSPEQLWMQEFYFLLKALATYRRWNPNKWAICLFFEDSSCFF